MLRNTDNRVEALVRERFGPVQQDAGLLCERFGHDQAAGLEGLCRRCGQDARTPPAGGPGASSRFS